jgi:hypothetical protein
MNPRVVSVHPTSNSQLALVFTNGETGVYDCSHLLDFGGFRELRDPAYFPQAQVLDGTVAWPHGQDICPDTLYLDSARGADLREASSSSTRYSR